MKNNEDYNKQKIIENERKRFIAEDEKRRFMLEKQYSQDREILSEENVKKAPTSVFEGINQDEFTKRSHEAILSNLQNEGIEDIDEQSEEDDEEWFVPSRY